MRILDVLLSAAALIYLLYPSDPRGLYQSGAISLRNTYFLYECMVFYDKREHGRPIIDKHIYVICLLEELTQTYARNIKQELIFTKMFHTPSFIFLWSFSTAPFLIYAWNLWEDICDIEAFDGVLSQYFSGLNHWIS